MRGRRAFSGRAASPGRALGPVVLLDESPEAASLEGQVQQALAPRGPRVEADAFDAACAAAARALQGLAQTGPAAEILAVQLALLEDPALVGPVRKAIFKGARAETAWCNRLDAELADWAGTDGPADDLRDLRDRVLAALARTETRAEMSFETGAETGAETVGQNAPERDAGPVRARCRDLDGAILVGRGLMPSAFLALKAPGGVAVTRGTPLGHLAILARAQGVPLITGLDPAALDALDPSQGDRAGPPLALLDADRGCLILEPDGQDRALSSRPGTALDGARPSGPARSDLAPQARAVRLCVNIDRAEDLARASADWEGVGLMRSEALYADGPPDEAAQLAAYRAVLLHAQGRPVAIRTLDAGGDKPLAWLGGVRGAQRDGNPALGLRGIRLSLAEPELLRTQLRALARAAASGPLSVMLPFVTLPEELDAARAYLDAACDALAVEGYVHARPQLGVMIETPAAALTAGAFPADFLAIGSNDLAQHLMAAARDDPAVAAYHQPRHPALLECLARCVAAGRARGIPVSLCGELGAEPACLTDLARLGLGAVSVSPGRLAETAAQIARTGHAA